MSVLQARSGGYSKSVAGSRCSLEVQREQPRLTLYVLKSMWWSAGKETQSRWRDRTAWRRRTAGPFQGRSCGAGLLQDSFLPRPARAPPARSEHAVQQAQCKLGVRKQSKDVGSATAVLTVLLRGSYARGPKVKRRLSDFTPNLQNWSVSGYGACEFHP